MDNDTKYAPPGYIHLPRATTPPPPTPTPPSTPNMEDAHAQLDAISKDFLVSKEELEELQKRGENPKDRIGITKPNLFVVPPAAQIYMALAMQDGAVKYGPYNWRENAVKASIYIAACQRHLLQWLDGQDNAEDSGKPHLAHAMACLGILADAIETGNLVDDRPLPGSSPELIEFWTEKPNE